MQDFDLFVTGMINAMDLQCPRQSFSCMHELTTTSFVCAETQHRLDIAKFGNFEDELYSYFLDDFSLCSRGECFHDTQIFSGFCGTFNVVTRFCI